MISSERNLDERIRAPLRRKVCGIWANVLGIASGLDLVVWKNPNFRALAADKQ